MRTRRTTQTEARGGPGEAMPGKLVRDFIPDLIRARGGSPVVRVLDEPAYRLALLEKLREEVDEFLASGHFEELADIVEVVLAVAELSGASHDELERLRLRKRAERGGFEKRLFLEAPTE